MHVHVLVGDPPTTELLEVVRVVLVGLRRVLVRVVVLDSREGVVHGREISNQLWVESADGVVLGNTPATSSEESEGRQVFQMPNSRIPTRSSYAIFTACPLADTVVSRAGGVVYKQPIVLNVPSTVGIILHAIVTKFRKLGL